MYKIKFLDGTEKEFETLVGADLIGADLYKTYLRGANLRGANLRGANLYEANLYKANLYEADLRETNLRGANLRGANLYEANLYKADLNEADLREADLYGSCLIATRLEHAIGIFSFIGGKYQALAYKYNQEKRVKIGCKDMTVEEWLEKGLKIATKEGFTREEIKDYFLFIKLVSLSNSI